MWISMGDKYVNSSPANLIVGVDVVKITAVCHVSGKGGSHLPPLPSLLLQLAVSALKVLSCKHNLCIL